MTVILYTSNPVRNANSLSTKDPTASPQSFSGILKRYNGATWVKAKLKQYNGSFVLATLKRWTGAAWVQVDATGV